MSKASSDPRPQAWVALFASRGRTPGLAENNNVALASQGVYQCLVLSPINNGSFEPLWCIGPLEGLALLVVALYEVHDGLNQGADGGEHPAADDLAREDAELQFHLVEPGGMGGGEVKVHPGVPPEPPLHRFMLMGTQVVHDEVQLLVGVGTGQKPQELQELLVAMPGGTLADDFALMDWQGGIELTENVIDGEVYHREVPAGESVTWTGLKPGPYVIHVTQAYAAAQFGKSDIFDISETSQCTATFTSDRPSPGKGVVKVECQEA